MKIAYIITGILAFLFICTGVVTCSKSNNPKNKIGSPEKKIKIKEMSGIITHKQIDVRFFGEDDVYIKLNNNTIKKLHGKNRIMYNVGDTFYVYKTKTIDGYRKNEQGVFYSKISIFAWLLGIIFFISFMVLTDLIYNK